jgi:hypothetical protein
MSEQGFADLLHELGDLVQVIVEADPADKAALYKDLGLQLTYRPEKQLVEARVIPDLPSGKRPGAEMARDSLSYGRSIAADLRLTGPE